ncbi:hypothetical protein [uncultured Thermomonospora sp.]|jgi:hypothetical protein|uniref:hypothetical protein n=1 Tax=uncultured Thermomonospora sp. TaxID=671175 RepID=UPI00259BB2E6|nr:hypothetical protein [uncultured Thermomonospora sp.]
MVALLTVRRGNTVVDQCNATCYEASGKVCRCVCGGANHGVGLEQAVVNTRAMHAAWVARARATRGIDTFELGEIVEQLPLF